jgi:hypothetical protein
LVKTNIQYPKVPTKTLCFFSYKNPHQKWWGFFILRRRIRIPPVFPSGN